MAVNILYILIKAACADGIITDSERKHLENEADKMGVSIENLNFLINAELENYEKSENSGFITANKNVIEQSGFVTQNKNVDENSGFITDNKNTNEESGFVTTNNSTNNYNNNNQIFTDVSQFPEQGAMSLVQKAKYFGKWVIVKRLKPQFSKNQKYIELFYKEFENAYHLDHPNIARVNGKGEDQNGVYYFMEFIDGQSLKQLIKVNGIENGNLIKKITLETLEALSYVHKKQVYHRDLKPSNILVTYKGDNVKLIDFGLALADSYDDDLKIVGTPKYASPEQFTSGFNADARSDIFSFGLILLEILTGQIVNTDLAKLRSLPAFLIIKKCVEKNPVNRYQNCNQIIEEFRKIEIESTLLSDINNDSFELNSDKNNLIDEIQTVSEFFKLTFKKWKNGDLKELENKFSVEPTYEQKSENKTFFDLIIDYYNEDFDIFFKNNFILQNEYLLKSDNKKIFITNYRIFIRNSNDESYTMILFHQLNLKTEKVNSSNPIYVIFRNFKIWQSDWELILKILQKKEWAKLSENQINILESKKDNARKYINPEKVILSYDAYNSDFESFPFTTIRNFLATTKNKWESIDYAKYFGNRIIDHSETIKNYIPVIEEFFADFYPYKNEFLILDCFHKQGFITNLRLFYYDNISKKNQAIILNEIESYKLADDVYTDLGGVEIITKNQQNIQLTNKYQSMGFAKTRVAEMDRIKKFIELSKSGFDDNIFDNSYLTLDKNRIEKIYF